MVMQPSQRDGQLAEIFLDHSLHIKPKEHVLISVSNLEAFGLVKAIFGETLKRGAYPLLDTHMDFYVNRSPMYGLLDKFYKHANDWQLHYIPKEMMQAQADWADAHIRIVTPEKEQFPPEKVLLRSKLTEFYRNQVVNGDRWLLTYFPTPAMAQDAGVDLDWFIDFYYKTCIVDYKKMEKDLLGIEKVLDKGKQVHIVGKDTDIRFSIDGRLAKACYGERNIPDGEVFLAPVWQTVEGQVYFDFPTLYAGSDMSGIYLEFKKGKVVKAKAQKNIKAVEKILATDEGARSLGELGIGANYAIQQALKNTLFDEKIGGTIHMALGRSYQEDRGGAPKGHNDSAIHWDIVKNMKLPGSTLFVDNKPLLKEGKFLV